MPRKPNKPCRHTGCPRLIPSEEMYCDEHRNLHPVPVYRTTKEKGYDGRWRKARAGYLKAHPLCVKCQSEGRLVKATVVDHIIPHRGSKELFWDSSNWQSLCKPCHDRKTMTEDRYVVYEYTHRG